MNVALAFARLPRPGRVKTRLARHLGAAEACRIYRDLAADVHDALCAWREASGGRLHVCLPDEDLAQDDPDWLPGADARWAQGTGDLGARMARLMGRAFASGAAHVLVVGTDIVGLDDRRLAGALAALERHDIAVAPTPDGGYGLLAMSRKGFEGGGTRLFEDVSWSTPRVMRRTRQRAAEAALDLALLPALRDVDEVPDLEGVLPTLSILIPTRNEAERLPPLLQALASQAAERPEGVEILVVDGGSTDGTLVAAKEAHVRVLASAPGRGVQLAAGGQAARGRWLWTLHADTRVEPGALQAVLDYCRRAPRPWACCHARFDEDSFFMRFIDCMADGRARLLRRPYGDQGLLVSRGLYEQVGGYEALPLMEDLQLSAACARRTGGPGRVETTLLVDGRRFRHHGWMGTVIRDLLTVFRFTLLRTKADRLARDYYCGTERGMARRGVLFVLAAVLVAGVAAFALLGSRDGEHGSVRVRILDDGGQPISGAHVAWRGEKILRTTNADGYAQLPWLPALGAPTPRSDLALRELQAGGTRHAPHPDHEPRIVRDGGTWHLEARLMTFGRVTLRIDPTLLPNVRARVEVEGEGRAVAEDGVAVARVGQSATWRVFPPTKRIVITVEGDIGTAMQRYSLPAPSVGYHQQERIEALPSAAIGVAANAPSGLEPPARSGLLLLVEDEASAEDKDEPTPPALDQRTSTKPLPLHAVRVPASGSVLVPHTAKKRYRIVMLWDFMSPSPPVHAEGGGVVDIPVPYPEAWCPIAAPEGAPPVREMRFRATPVGEVESTRHVAYDPPLPAEWQRMIRERKTTPRIVHHEAQPYLVLESLGTWRLQAWRDGTDESPPWRGEVEITVKERGANPITLAGAEEPHGTLVITVPKALRSAAEVQLPGERRATMLRVTKQLRIRHLRPGAVPVRIVWRSDDLPDREQTVQIKAGEETVWALEARSAPTAGN